MDSDSRMTDDMDYKTVDMLAMCAAINFERFSRMCHNYLKRRDNKLNEEERDRSRDNKSKELTQKQNQDKILQIKALAKEYKQIALPPLSLPPKDNTLKGNTPAAQAKPINGAFDLFAADLREVILKKYPNVRKEKLQKVIAEKWRDADQTKKLNYQRKYEYQKKKDQDKLKQQLPAQQLPKTKLQQAIGLTQIQSEQPTHENRQTPQPFREEMVQEHPQNIKQEQSESELSQ